MTYETGGSLRTSSLTVAVTPGNMNKRGKLTNTLPVHSLGSKSGNSMEQTNTQRRAESTRTSRRYSSPQAKNLISPIYRERPSARGRVVHSDLSLTYPTPELKYDFSKLESETKHDDDNSVKDKKIDEAVSRAVEITSQHVKPLNVGNNVSFPHEKPIGNELETSPQNRWRNTLLSMRNSRRFSLPVTTLEKQLEKALTLASQTPKEKNEAEIIEDGRRGSLEDGVNISVPGTATFRLPGRFTGVGGVGRSASVKTGRVDSLNRELRSHYKNSMQERKLRNAHDDLDRRSYAGIMEHRNRQQQISQQHTQLLKRSPTTEDWLYSRQCRTASLQEREREAISRRFSRRARHFRAPKALQDQVSNIRSVAMFHAGLYDTSRAPPSSPAEAKMLLRRISTAVAGGGCPIRIDGRKNSRSGEYDKRDDDKLINLVFNENAEIHNPLESKDRKTVSEGDTAAVLRQVHNKSITPRAADSRSSGLVAHSSRVPFENVPSLEDVSHGFPEDLLGNIVSGAATARSRLSILDQGTGAFSEEGEPARREEQGEEDSFDNVPADVLEFQNAEDISDSESNVDPFSDLDQMSSDTEIEDDAFEDRRNI